MAKSKKGKTEGVLAKQTRLKAEADAAKAAADAAEVARQAAEAKRAAREEAERLRAEKKAVKKPRYVRPEAEKRPEAAAPLPARSTTRSGKLMSAGLKLPPKAKPGSKPRGPG